jgi:hypothetical protein
MAHVTTNDMYDGTGAQNDFVITFSYQARSFIEVYVDAVLQTSGGTDYAFLNNTTIRFEAGSIPGVGTDNVEIRRVTSTTPLIDWVAGASITDTDLDTSQLQLLNIVEELHNDFAVGLGKSGGHWDGDGLRITNVAAPIADTDVATKASIAAQVTAAELAETNAETAETNAAASAAAASTSETNAATSETNAAASATTLPHGFISGLTLSRAANDVSLPLNSIQIEAGRCRDVTNAADLSVPGLPKVKRLDAACAKGSGNGGFPSSLVATRTLGQWYRVFIIGRNVDDEVEAGFDELDATEASNLRDAFNTIDGDSSWVYYRQLGYIKIDDTTIDAYVPFMNRLGSPNEFWFLQGKGGGDSLDVTSAPTLYTGTGVKAERFITLNYCPPNEQAIVNLTAWSAQNSGTCNYSGLVRPTDGPSIAPNNTDSLDWSANLASGSNLNTNWVTANNKNQHFHFRMQLDDSQQFNEQVFGILGTNLATCYSTLGFTFDRDTPLVEEEGGGE